MKDAIDHWTKADPVLADLARSTDIPRRLEREADAFTSLVRSIVHQQVSLAAGTTIFGRVAEATGPTPDGVLAAGEVRLRAAGLSRAKVGYILDLAARVADGSLDLAALAELDDDAATAALTQVRGIGAWSAKMHLIFHMGRPDVCPWEDLGVRLAVERFYGVPMPDTTKWLKAQQAKWSPFNSLAARVLWAARREP